MAKTLYVPVNNLSKETKKIIVPVGGVSKYAVKGYSSVNGLSKQFWGASEPKDYEEVYPGPTVNPSYLKNCWVMPLYVHQGPFTVKRTYNGVTETLNMNIPNDGYVVNNSLYQPDYIKIQIMVFFKDQPSVSPRDVSYWFDRDVYFKLENNIRYYQWILQPRQYEWECAIKESVRTAYGETDSIYSQWEAPYIIFNKA